MELEFVGEVIEWRGPAPFYYVVIPEDESDAIASVATAFTYGWGVIPVRAEVAPACGPRAGRIPGANPPGIRDPGPAIATPIHLPPCEPRRWPNPTASS